MKRRLTELAGNQVGVVLDGHLQEASAEAILRKDEEDVLEDGPDLLQLRVVEVLQHEDHDGRDDPDEQVQASLKTSRSVLSAGCGSSVGRAYFKRPRVGAKLLAWFRIPAAAIGGRKK